MKRLFVTVILLSVIGCSSKTPNPLPNPIAPAPGPSPTAKAVLVETPGNQTASADTGKSIVIPVNLKPGGLIGEYFQWKDVNIFYPGQPLYKQLDKQLDFYWAMYSPSDKLDKDHFSIRWSGYLMADKEGDYLLQMDSDDGTRLTIDDKQIFPMNLFRRKTTVHLTKGLHKILLEYYELEGMALCFLFWTPPGNEALEIIPPSHLYYDSTAIAS